MSDYHSIRISLLSYHPSIYQFFTSRILVSINQSITYICILLDKDNCRTCEIVLKKIETIDDDCDALGIEMVRVKDPVFAKT